MSPVERAELAHAMERMDERFERFDQEARAFREQVGADINSLKRDMAFIKGATKIVTVFLTLAVPAMVAIVGWLVK